MSELREKIIDLILKVAMGHHDDISASDMTGAENAADDILELLSSQSVMSEAEIEKVVRLFIEPMYNEASKILKQDLSESRDIQIHNLSSTLFTKLSAKEERCVCGEPLTLGVVHRKNKPCYIPDPPKEAKIENLDYDKWGTNIAYEQKVIAQIIRHLNSGGKE